MPALTSLSRGEPGWASFISPVLLGDVPPKNARPCVASADDGRDERLSCRLSALPIGQEWAARSALSCDASIFVKSLEARGSRLRKAGVWCASFELRAQVCLADELRPGLPDPEKVALTRDRAVGSFVVAEASQTSGQPATGRVVVGVSAAYARFEVGVGSQLPLDVSEGVLEEAVWPSRGDRQPQAARG